MRKQEKFKKNDSAKKNIALILLLILIFLYIFYLGVQIKQPNVEELPYNSFLQKVNSASVSEVTIQGNEIRGRYRTKGLFKTYIPYNDPNLISTLVKNRVKVYGSPLKDKPSFFETILNLLWIILPVIILWNLFFKNAQGTTNKIFSFGKSKARLITPNEARVTFADVAGIDEAKEEVKEIIDFLKDPQKFVKIGARIPKGVLLVGPPGTGKTLLAKAIAGEAGVPFLSISGSDFVEMFVGVGASRVRDLFEKANKNAPCIIFIDEIDAVGRYRGAGIGGGHDEREQTLNQLLVELDGFNTNKGIIVLAATNRPDVLDNALLRPGRFDRQIVVDIPDVKGREEILKVHTKGKPLAPDVDLSKIARGTPGFTGADLENLVNEAALIAARKNKKLITNEDFEFAKDKVLMGPERKSLFINEKEKTLTAYHEAGHTLLSKLLKNTDPIHKVTIIPRGRALGITQHLPIDERHTYPKEYWEDNLVMIMGGRAAEEVKFNTITTGAKNDIEKATEIARKMVREWGMSKKLGPISVASEREHIFLGREIAQHKDYSEETAVLIDREVNSIIKKSYEKAKRLLKQNKHLLDAIASELIKKETLDSNDIENIIKSIKKRKQR